MHPTLTDEEKVGTLPNVGKVKVYKIRWFILALFVLYSASNAMQWIQYSIIANVIHKFYGVSNMWIDWTSMIYMILYIPFIFPGSYLLDKLGLRAAVIIGIVGTCLGSWIKVASVQEDRFWVGFLGQSIVGLAQVFVLSVPPRLAAVWFGASEVSSACSVGVFGNQLGIAIGFVLPPLLVESHDETKENIKSQLYILFMGVAIFTSILLVLILLFFKNEPPTPPTYALSQQLEDEHDNFLKSLKRLLSNRSYLFLLTAYGINTGVFYAISTLLNQIILKYYPDGNRYAGEMGLVIIIAGMIGSVVCGIILDKFHKYKETTLAVYALSLVSMVIYTFCLSGSLLLIFIISGLLGFFMTGLLPVGFELAAELTYPEPEGTSAGLLNAASQVFGIAFTTLYALLLDDWGDIWANSIMSVMLLFGTILTSFVSSDLKRQAANSTK